MGEHTGNGVHIIIVEEKRNILIGLGIFIGFATFFFMEKTLRVLGGEEDAPGHSHSHSHSHIEPEASKASGVASPSTTQNGVRKRKSDDTNGSSEQQEPQSISGPSKLSAYLNLFGDFVHNIMAASFYASPLIGATTTLACFAHEIPHEIADYSILIRSGFTKKQAMQSQFLTAVGAFHFYRDCGVRQDATGLLGTTLQLSDLVIPFVAGGFLYIGAVAVLPTLLAESKSAKQAIREASGDYF
ncbi:Zinc transporter zipt-7.2 [Psilocybe cubensis]|nr:Zinc transporter zipt-7.2 [Psilocybe cubensis]KAH9481240.1 Zinc transporter zipt-7.2 [Psilocybe cubensis]